MLVLLLAADSTQAAGKPTSEESLLGQRPSRDTLNTARKKLRHLQAVVGDGSGFRLS
jgi:hypothetical protein